MCFVWYALQGLQILKLRLPAGDFACFIVRQPVINGTAAVANVRSSDSDSSEASFIKFYCMPWHSTVTVVIRPLPIFT